MSSRFSFPFVEENMADIQPVDGLVVGVGVDDLVDLVVADPALVIGRVMPRGKIGISRIFDSGSLAWISLSSARMP